LAASLMSVGLVGCGLPDLHLVAGTGLLAASAQETLICRDPVVLGLQARCGGLGGWFLGVSCAAGPHTRRVRKAQLPNRHSILCLWSCSVC
jgi:hypothetical protein